MYKKYKILSTKWYTLEKEVNDWIELGWIPIGGVSATSPGTWSQAMVLPADKPETEKKLPENS